MAIPIKFSKPRVREFLEAVKKGRPFPPGPLGWSSADMIQLAGVCRFATMTHGPETFGKEDFRLMHREHREASGQQFLDDLTAAIEWCSQGAQLVEDGEYDEYFEEEHAVLVQLRNAERGAVPLFGWKDSLGLGDVDEDEAGAER